MEDYTTRNPPYFLPCSKHIMCRKCIIGLIKTGRTNSDKAEKTFIIKCPFDNKITNISKNKSTEEIILAYFEIEELKYEKITEDREKKVSINSKKSASKGLNLKRLVKK